MHKCTKELRRKQSIDVESSRIPLFQFFVVFGFCNIEIWEFFRFSFIREKGELQIERANTGLFFFFF